MRGAGDSKKEFLLLQRKNGGGEPMGVSRIPLAYRLDRLARGYASDPAFVRSAIRTLAQTPLLEYFGPHADALEALAQKFGMPASDAGFLTYMQAAVAAGSIPSLKEREYAAFLLAVPIFRSCVK